MFARMISSRVSIGKTTRFMSTLRSPLLSTGDVQDLMNGNTKYKLVDASWYLDKSRNGRQEYETARLPGAVFFDIEEISDKTSTLPHMLPTSSTFETAMQYLGINNDDTIVVYGGKNCFRYGS